MIQFEGQIISNFPKLIWKAWAPPKCKFFEWFLLQDKLWTSQRLQLRAWPNNYFCALCERNLETAHHLFFECPFARSVWALVANWSGCHNLRLQFWYNVCDMELCFLEIVDGGGKLGHSLAVLTLWMLWKQRNDFVFRGTRKDERHTFFEIKEECYLWSISGGHVLKPLFVANNALM